MVRRALWPIHNRFMGCPICGEHCTCPREGATRTVVLESDPPRADSAAEGADQGALYAAGDLWRDEVAARVDAFCARRGRKRVPRTPSLSLDFERAARATVAAHYSVPEPEVQPGFEPPQVIPPDPQLEPEPAPSNVIEFPRATPAPPPPPPPPLPLLQPLPYVDELAEPIVEKPRILDAEEPSGLLFGSESRPTITLESNQTEPEHPEEAGPIEGGASLARRIFAAVCDGVLIATASALFGAIFLYIVGTMPRTRVTVAITAALPVLLWAIYEYLFLVHAAGTPGMRLARVRVRTFDGMPARRSIRRWRAIAMVVSGLALGMGFFWAAIDEYGLCWHDRITRTFLRRKVVSRES
mgnify:CR=1 FL=1